MSTIYKYEIQKNNTFFASPIFSLYYLDNDEVSEALDLGGECEAEEEGEEAGAEHAHGEEVAEVLHQSELSTGSRDLLSTNHSSPSSRPPAPTRT